MKRTAKRMLVLSVLFGAACAATDERATESDHQVEADRPETFAQFEARVSTLTDRSALRDEILAVVGRAKGPAIDDETRAWLAVIEARVDDLSGLIYSVDTEDGATLKFFEPELGQVTVALSGPPEVAGRYRLSEQDPIRLFELAQPGREVPVVLRDAAARQHELSLRARAYAAQETSASDLPIELELSPPPEDETPEPDADKHLSTAHGYMSTSAWKSHCFAWPNACWPHLTGSRTADIKEVQGAEWLYMLNETDLSGHPLGQILVATFRANFLPGSTVKRDFILFDPDPVGPLMSVVGGMVKVGTAGPTLEQFPCTWPASCGSQIVKPLMNHHAEFAAGPGARWHLSVRGFSDVFAQNALLFGNVLQL